MFKYLLTLLLTFVIGSSTVALSQNYYCYGESGSTVELTVQDSIVSVKLDESRASWQGLFLSESGLDPTVAPEPICEGFERSVTSCAAPLRPAFAPAFACSV